VTCLLSISIKQVIFIATANSKDTIPEALLDRMEVIDVVGYTTEEKTQIASIHLLPKLLKEHGLSQYDLVVPKQTLVAICERYTREPGVRTLERQIAAVCRAAAVRVLEKDRQKEVEFHHRHGGCIDGQQKSEPIHVQPDHLQTILGPPFYQGEEDLVCLVHNETCHSHLQASRVSHPGVAIGMAASQLVLSLDRCNLK
jgi:ATP-dependent Lon protease